MRSDGWITVLRSTIVIGFAVIVMAGPESAPTGDYDGDGIVGLVDYAYLAECLLASGPTVPPSSPECVDTFDFDPLADPDGDVDLRDVARFQNIFGWDGVQPPIRGKHLTYDNIAIHDPYSPGYDGDCIGCHGKRLHEVAMDGVTPTAHAQMLAVLGSAEWLCVACHRNVDFRSESGANVRKQVSLEENACTSCHDGSSPEVPQFYVR